MPSELIDDAARLQYSFRSRGEGRRYTRGGPAPPAGPPLDPRPSRAWPSPPRPGPTRRTGLVHCPGLERTTPRATPGRSRPATRGHLPALRGRLRHPSSARSSDQVRTDYFGSILVNKPRDSRAWRGAADGRGRQAGACAGGHHGEPRDRPLARVEVLGGGLIAHPTRPPGRAAGTAPPFLVGGTYSSPAQAPNSAPSRPTTSRQGRSRRRRLCRTRSRLPPFRAGSSPTSSRPRPRQVRTRWRRRGRS
jgi:hypothetical protein